MDMGRVKGGDAGDSVFCMMYVIAFVVFVTTLLGVLFS